VPRPQEGRDREERQRHDDFRSLSSDCYDEHGKPMHASKQVSDPAYADRYIAESRELLATVPTAS
jgi:hypothetical protein